MALLALVLALAAPAPPGLAAPARWTPPVVSSTPALVPLPGSLRAPLQGRPGAPNAGDGAPAAGADPAQDPTKPLGDAVVEDENSFVLTFDESVEGAEGLNVLKFIKFCQQKTGINFYIKRDLVPKLEQMKILMLGPKRVPKAKFYDFFQSILKINDLVLVLEGGPETGVWVITDTKGPDRAGLRNSARYIAPEEIPNYATQPGVLVTTVITVEYTNAREISASLRPFFPDNNLETVTNIGNANALLVTGFGPTVFSIQNLLKLIDTPPTEPKPLFHVIEIQHTSADEVSQILDDLIEKRRSGTVQAQGAGGGVLQGQAPELKIRVDGRSNQLLVVGLEADVRQVMEIVARLDKSQPEPESDFHVYRLKNVKAEDLQKTLEDFINKSFQAQQTSGAAGGGGRAGAQGTTSTSASRELKPVVVPEKVSNSLLVTATKTRWLEILDMIERLDRRQAQVLLETALVELTTTDALRLGVELGIVNLPPDGSDVSKGFGITNFGLSSLIDTDGDNFPDTRIPDSSLQGITGGILSGPDFGIPALLQALRTVTDSNVLSIPSVLVNNNERARVSSKDLIPTATTTNSVNVGTQTTFGGYQEAGITLEITPSISAQSYLRLEISLQVANFTAPQGQNANIPPPKVEREVYTTVYLPNESTMVIGGIQLDNSNKSKTGIPILGDLPIIGFLFSRHDDDSMRRSLYFFVTPHILTDVEFADLQNISYQKKLDARAYIGDDRLRLVDPSFRPIEPTEDGESGSATLESGVFEIPLYRRPAGGEVVPAEVGILPPESVTPPAPVPEKPND